METNTPAEGNSESESTPASQSKRSVIDSISVELIAAKEKEDPEKCQHFSIRGYVAEMRKKDMEICWPFSSVGNFDESKKQMNMLPPLHVAEFRWWGCQNCLQKTVATGAATEIGVVSDWHNIGLKSNITSSCGNPFMSSGDALMIPSSFKQAFGKRTFERRKDDADTYINVNCDDHCPSLCNDKKGKKAEVAYAVKEGENVNKANFKSTFIAQEANPWLTGVKEGTGKFGISSKADCPECNLAPCDTEIASDFICHKKIASGVSPELKGYDMILHPKPNCESHEVVDVDFDPRNLKSTSNRSAEICWKGNPGIFRNDLAMMNEKHLEVMTDCGIYDVVSLRNKALNTLTDHTSKLRSLDLDESDHEFTENIEHLVGVNPHDHHNGSDHGNLSGVFHGRKPRKVRLLTDVIRSEVLGVPRKVHSSAINGNSDHINTEVASSKATLEASIGRGLDAVPKTHTGIEENVKKGGLGKKKRKKVHAYENWGPKENNHEKVRNIKGVAESCHTDCDIINSKSTEDAVVRNSLHAGFNSKLTKDRFDRKLILCQKKSKKPRVEDAQSSLTPQGKGVSRDAQVLCKEKIKHNEAENLPLKSAEDTSTGKGLKSFLKCYFSAKEKYRKSTLCKKRSKMAQTEDKQACLTTGGECISRKEKVMRKCVEIKRTGAESLPPKTSKDAFTGGQKHPFRKIHSAAKAKQGKCTFHKNKGELFQAGGGKATLKAPQLSMPRENQIAEKDIEINHTGVRTVPYISGLDSFTVSRLHPSCEGNLSAERDIMESLSPEKRTEMPPAEYGQEYVIPSQRDMVRENQNIRKEGKIKHQVNIPFRSDTYEISGRDIQHCLTSNKATYKMVDASKKQKNKPKIEGGASSSMWLEDVSGTRHAGNSIDVQSHPKLDKNQCDQRADKVSDAAVLDDIPMEIVELMARNQYERRLLDVEDATKTKYCLPEKSQNMKTTDVGDFTEVLQNEVLRMLQEKNSQMTKSQSSKNVGMTDQESISYPYNMSKQYKSIHFSTSQPEESVSLGFPTFPLSREKLSSGLTLYPPDSSNNCYPGIHNCNGDQTGYRCSYSCSDCTCRTPSRKRSCEEVHHGGSCEEVHHGGFSMMPNDMHVGVNSSQKSVTESGSKDVFSKCPEPLHFLKSLNPNATNLQKQQWKFDSGPCDRLPAANPFACPWKRNQCQSEVMGSLDLYTNESISAMHLLRLMDAGMPVNADKSQKYPKQPSFTCDQHCKELSGLGIGVSKTSKSLIPPPSDCFARNHSLGQFCEHFSPVPVFNAVSSSFQKVDNFRTATSFTGGFWSEKMEFGANKKSGISWPSKSNSRTEICSVNRNPADFTVPEAGNIYMIGGENLKRRKMVPSLDRPCLLSANGHKRQRIVKLTAI